MTDTSEQHQCPECGNDLDLRIGPFGVSYQCLAPDCLLTYAEDEIATP